MKKILAVALAAVCVLGGRAFADEGSQRDPAEWAGANYLDVTGLHHGHAARPELLRHSVRMRAMWDDYDLEDEDSFIIFAYNLDRDRKTEASVVIDYDLGFGGLYAYFQHHRDGARRVYLDPPLRPDGRTVSVDLNRDRFGARLHHYRWKVRAWASSENDADCADPLRGPAMSQYTVCRDTAPNRGWLSHHL